MEVSSFDIQRPFEPGVQPPASHEPGWWFLFHESRLVLERLDERMFSPLLSSEDPRPGARFQDAPHFLGYLAGTPCFTAEIDGEFIRPEYETRSLYGLHGRLDMDLFLLAGRAFQVLEWDRKHRFCGRCGTPTERAAQQRARLCPSCELAQFPRLTPAMMALVRRENQLLLARSPRFPEGFYSVLAGFAEPGETLEACVRREVREEVGLEIANIQYFASQPWPFPHSLMVAYLADYAGGEICIDGDEILEADWFTADNLPNVPGEMSIAGHLIRWFVDQQRG